MNTLGNNTFGLLREIRNFVLFIIYDCVVQWSLNENINFYFILLHKTIRFWIVKMEREEVWCLYGEKILREAKGFWFLVVTVIPKKNTFVMKGKRGNLFKPLRVNVFVCRRLNCQLSSHGELREFKFQRKRNYENPFLLKLFQEKGRKKFSKGI